MTADRRSNAPRVIIWFLVIAALVAGAIVYTQVEQGNAPVRIALVTADSDPYWEAVVEGARATADELDAELVVFKSNGELADQNRHLITVAAGNFSGLAVSPVDGGRQASALMELTNSMPVVTIDADSELSGRLCFVGPDNYIAGRRCGELLMESAPDGANIVIICGPMEKENGRQRRQGFIDEVLNRQLVSDRPMDPIEGQLSHEGYTVLGTYVDPIDPEQAKANVLAALEAFPNVDAIVGLYAYHVPMAVAALEEAGKLGSVRVVGFDDNEQTLTAIENGHVFGTIAQDQYSYGRSSVRLLVDVARADASGQYVAVPMRGHINYPPIMVKRDSLDQFKSERGRSRALMAVRPSPDGE